jgi:hypothetical protein
LIQVVVSYGIYAYGSVSSLLENISISNCDVSGFSHNYYFTYLNNSFFNNLISSGSSTYGLYSSNIYNSSFIGFSSTGHTYGSYLSSVYDSFFSNFNHSVPNNYGSYLSSVYDSIFTNFSISKSSSGGYGLYLNSYIYDNSFSNFLIFGNFGTGFYGSGAIQRSNFSNFKILDARYGVYLRGLGSLPSYYLKDSIFDSFLINNSGIYGVQFSSYLSGNSIFRNSIISNSGNYGVYNPSYFTFYNNLFNNSQNMYSTSSTTKLNSSFSSGTNIVGGSNFGGNVWTTPSGTGFSDTCTDSNSDDICDNSYTVPGSGSTDYLALSLNVSLPSPPQGNSTINSSGVGFPIFGNFSLWISMFLIVIYFILG